jgi:radical SAM superfamily enzyme YgiQ (UPF0313 family)
MGGEKITMVDDIDIAFVEPGTRKNVSLGCATAMKITEETGASTAWTSGKRDTQYQLFPVGIGKNGVFVSIYSPRQFPLIRAALSRFHVAEKRVDRLSSDPLVVVGGQAVTANPAAVWDIADIVATGDGEITIPALVDAIENGGKTGAIAMAAEGQNGLCAPGIGNAATPVWSPSISARLVRSCTGSRYAQIEVCRGCRGVCAFCQLGHVIPYREANGEDVIATLDRHMPRRVNLFAPSLGDHSQANELIDACRNRNIRMTNRNSQSFHIEKKQALTIGADAPSERIRRAIGKRVWKNSDIIRVCSADYTEAKVNFIIGYPGETEEDRKECSGLIADILQARGDRASYIYAALLIPYPHTAFEHCIDLVKQSWQASYEWIMREQATVAALNRTRKKMNIRWLHPATPNRAEIDTSLAWTGSDGPRRIVVETATDRTWQRYQRRLGVRIS